MRLITEEISMTIKPGWIKVKTVEQEDLGSILPYKYMKNTPTSGTACAGHLLNASRGPQPPKTKGGTSKVLL